MAASNGHGSGHGPVRSRRRDLHTALSYRRGRAVAVRQVVRIGRGSAAAVGPAMSLAAARLHPSAPDTRRSPSRLRRVEEGSRKAVRQFPPSSSSADGWLGSPSSPPRNLDLAENRRKFQLFASAAHHVALLLLLWPFAAQRLSPVRTRWATEKHFPILPCFFRLARRAAIFPRRGFFRSANFLLPRPPALRPRAQSNRPHTRACHGRPLLIRTFSPCPPIRNLLPKRVAPLPSAQPGVQSYQLDLLLPSTLHPRRLPCARLFSFLLDHFHPFLELLSRSFPPIRLDTPPLFRPTSPHPLPSAFLFRIFTSPSVSLLACTDSLAALHTSPSEPACVSPSTSSSPSSTFSPHPLPPFSSSASSTIPFGRRRLSFLRDLLDPLISCRPRPRPSSPSHRSPSELLSRSSSLSFFFSLLVIE
ncbi:uncharacterized protein PAN0_002c1192 [Moesziomyces antarcticus]|uniref:Uncharacterized protein n=1 Tax=Pseudozyma antarctica TaxID=84753 RepID=A0A5C3FHC0_PSEA2|nr:uncharacterized protein PAN0_002c1192 [Moesziomyces antarcticus]GAK62990.1 hypothetical protein PAN0_002c1192 [Moesziomyces antarcticus]SPO43526.1 uncharacterized protein PSANT_01211 [Moesziomyces antarcticus]